MNVIFQYLDIHVHHVQMQCKELITLNVIVEVDFMIMELLYVNVVLNLVKLAHQKNIVIHVYQSQIDKTILLIVVVIKDISKIIMLNVKNVPIGVEIVKIPLIIVYLVKMNLVEKKLLMIVLA